jgi:hypothetical protein|tara:strand:+ start:126 stop:260 length:135 start_codon:yes stop_codon:yes gene_type:complete
MYGEARKKKVKKLLKKGKKPKQAYAMAKSMERSGKLGPRGGYKK